MSIVSIDFETFSELDIKVVGGFKYASHPSTEVLCVAWSVEGEEPQLWEPTMPAPKELFELIEKKRPH